MTVRMIPTMSRPATMTSAMPMIISTEDPPSLAPARTGCTAMMGPADAEIKAD